MQDLLPEPSQAAFAMVEEFVDRLLRAEKSKKEWRIFLFEVRTQVWPEEFKFLVENSQIKEKWLTLIEKTLSINESNNMLFLK